MKLQVNDSGSWRDVLRDVPAERVDAVMRSSASLMQSLGNPRIKMRLLADRDTVFGYYDGSIGAWRFPK